jgi:hypothetical protein
METPVNKPFDHRRSKVLLNTVAIVLSAGAVFAAPALSASAAGAPAPMPLPEVTDSFGPEPTPPVCVNYAGGTQIVVDGVTTHLDVFCTAVTVSMSISAAHGDATIDRYGSIYYASESGFRGTDTLTVTAVSTRSGEGPTTTFDLEVAAPAVALDDTYTVRADTAFAPALSILRNDTTPYAGWIIQQGTTPPAHGTVTVDARTGMLVYTPDAEFTGTDSFLYRLSGRDGATSNVARVSFVVE